LFLSKNNCTPCTGDWADPRAVLDVLEKRKKSLSTTRIRTPDRPAGSLITIQTELLRFLTYFILLIYVWVVVKEIKQYQKKWLQHVLRMDRNRIQNKNYNIDQKDEGT
jgi:hypothetical protein